MANTNVPGKPVLIRFDGDEAMIEWSTPARSGYTWNVYASLSGTPPLAGPPMHQGLTKQQSNVYAPSIAGNVPPVNDFYIAITSVNDVTGLESAQGAPLLVSVSSGDAGDDSGTVAFVARDPSGMPSSLSADVSGRLVVVAGAQGAPVGLATEPKQDTQITQLTGVHTRQDSQLAQLNDIEVKQDTQIASLASIDTKTPVQGQTTMAASSPVVVSSDQTSIPVNIATGLDQRTVLQSQSIVMASEYTDAAERMRASVPSVIFSDDIRTTKNPFAWAELTANSGAVTFVSSEGAIDLTTTTTSGSRAVYQTKRYFHLSHSHSYRVTLSIRFGAPVVGNAKRAGYFSLSEGFFLEQSDSSMRVVVRSSISGSPVDTPVEQADWNIDTMNGAGPSGVSLDFSFGQALTIDMHPSGQVIFGFYVAGRFYQAHRLAFPNSSVTPALSGRVFPLTAETVNSAATLSGSAIRLYAAAVASEGEHQVVTYPFSANSGVSGVNITSGSTAPLMTIRTRSGFTSSIIRMTSIAFMNTNAADFLIRLVLNGTLGGSTFATPSGIVSEIDTAATTITGGTDLYSRYVTSSATGPAVEIALESMDIQLSTLVDGTRDTLSYVVTAITNTNGTRVAANWKEAI